MTEGVCTCTPYPAGNRGCSLHDAAENGRFSLDDRNYEDMRRRLGGPPLLDVQTTPAHVLELGKRMKEKGG